MSRRRQLRVVSHRASRWGLGQRARPLLLPFRDPFSIGRSATALPREREIRIGSLPPPRPNLLKEWSGQRASATPQSRWSRPCILSPVLLITGGFDRSGPHLDALALHLLDDLPGAGVPLIGELRRAAGQRIELRLHLLSLLK